MNSRIEQIIEELENYIDECKFQPLSNSKIVVNKEEISELLNELKEATPDEIRKYQKIISNRDAILKNAQNEAERIIQRAQIHTNEMVSEHQIMLQATAQAKEVVSIATSQAQEIMDNATAEAEAMKTAAVEYTDSLLGNYESILGSAIDDMQTKYSALINSLSDSYDVVRANRKELAASQVETAPQARPVVANDPNSINLL